MRGLDHRGAAVFAAPFFFATAFSVAAKRNEVFACDSHFAAGKRRVAGFVTRTGIAAMGQTSFFRAGGLALLATAMLAGTSGVAAAKPSTKDRVTTLEAEVAELKAAAEGARASAVRLDQLEREVRTLTGRVEELTFDLERANARINSLTQALSGEVDPAFEAGVDGGLGRSGAAAGGPTMLGPPQAPAMEAGGVADAGAAATASVDDVELPIDPEAAFEYANNFLFQEDLPRAEAAFSLFVSAFGAHPRAADARFRLGEVLLAQGKYARAADAFVEYIRRHPNEARVPEAYLKLSAAFTGLGEAGEACKVLRAAKAKYTDRDPAFSDRANAAIARAGCS